MLKGTCTLIISLILATEIQAQDKFGFLAVGLPLSEKELKSEQVYQDMLAAMQNVDEVYKLKIGNLDTFPIEILAFRHLHELDIYTGKIKRLPDGLGDLRYLQHLRFDGFDIEKLPDWVGNHKNLRYLSFSGNKIKEIPTTINKLTKLEALSANSNQLREIPLQLCEIESLRRMNISYNPIEKLPEDWSKMQNLEFVDLRGTKLIEFPEQLLCLSNLNQLYTSNLDCQNLSDSLLKAHKKLVNLYISGPVGAAEFPVKLCQLSKLKGIRLGETKIDSLPKEFAQLKKLNYLHFHSNEFTELPKVLLRMKWLKKISIGEYRISKQQAEDWQKRLQEALPKAKIEVKAYPRKPRSKQHWENQVGNK